MNNRKITMFAGDRETIRHAGNLLDMIKNMLNNVQENLPSEIGQLILVKAINDILQIQLDLNRLDSRAVSFQGCPGANLE
jgi:hypothetical protein